MNDFTVYSFFTIDTPYQDTINKYLIGSINALKKPVKLQVIAAKNYHHWGKNVAQKPLIIMQLLDEGKDNIVFVDADATIEQYPQLFHDIDNKFDLAFYTLDWNTWYRNKSDIKEILSGTMFFRNRKIVKDLCAEWYAKAQDGSCWEQQILANILPKYNLKIYPLPISYCYIDTLPNGGKPHVQCNDITIRHHQISRTLKRRGKL